MDLSDKENEELITAAKKISSSMIENAIKSSNSKDCDKELIKNLIVGLDLLAHYVMNKVLSKTKGNFSATLAMEDCNYVRDKIYELSRVQARTATKVVLGDKE